MILSRLFALWISLVAAGFFSGAAAQTRITNEYTATEIVAETNGLAPGETTWFALRQEVRDGWHVFWVNPGDAGLPLDLNWTLPAGFETGDVLHPVPEYIPVGPLASFAHEGAPIFLASVTAPADLVVGDTVSVAIDATWQACEDICVPEEGRFEFTLPVIDPAARVTQHAALFEAARSALPAAGDDAATFSVRNGAYVLDMAPVEAAPESIFFFPAPEGLIEPAGDQRIVNSDNAMSVIMQPGYVETYDEDNLFGVLSFVDEAGAYRGIAINAALPQSIVKPSENAAAIAAAANANIPLMLLMALVGGMILNLMPCVFPILFVKAASLMQSVGEDRSVSPPAWFNLCGGRSFHISINRRLVAGVARRRRAARLGLSPAVARHCRFIRLCVVSCWLEPCRCFYHR